ncbi:MAG: TonB-dependent receptor [Muribaculaceae bacterium]|nr:TonB-dependent receptor [Muribaculaceae bacterium]
MKYLIALYLSLISPILILSQTIINGKVLEETSEKAIIGANIMVKNLNGRMIGFSTSDKNGDFHLNIRESADSLIIDVTAKGYKTFSHIIKADQSPLTVYMEDGAVHLKEVVVKETRLREHGDTLVYKVGSFAQKQDRTIGDVLKRMPGIEVTGSGKILYQGNDIGKFYIEGNDLLEGKYGIATNGISYEDIGSVEVMENHQPMQVLRGFSFADQAAINLRLKNRAKASLLIHGSIGGGWSQQPKGGLWQADIFTMMVTGRYQMITTLKGNNTGLNLSDQLMDFSSYNQDEYMEGYISLSAPMTPYLNSNRSYFNRSWLISSSHLLRTQRNNEIKAQIDYSNDRFTAQGLSSTTYFLESGENVILENRNSISHHNALTAKFTYEANEENFFLKNTLSSDISWDDLSLYTSGTLPNIQNASMPSYSVRNLLQMIRRFGRNKLVTFNSHNEWRSLPEKLNVKANGKEYGQLIDQHSFYTDQRALMGYKIHRVLLSLESGLSGYFRNLNTELWGIVLNNLTEDEELTTNYLRIFISPKIAWKFRCIELNLDVPVNLYSYFFSGKLQNRTEFLISPILSTRINLNSKLSITLRGNTHKAPVSLHDIHNSYILTDYRSFNAGVDNYYTSSGQSLSANLSYRNAMNGIFLMAMGSLGWTKSKFGYARDIIGDYIFYSNKKHPSHSRNTMLVLNASKTLDFIRGGIGIRGNYRRMVNRLFSQGNETIYINDSYTVTPFINGNLSSLLNWSLKFTWDTSSLRVHDSLSHSVNGFIYSGSLTFTPFPLITWSTGGEYYHNQISGKNYKNIMILDTKLTFNISKRLDISLSVTNILNQKSYSYTTYGRLSQCERANSLRGREFLISIYLKK